MLYYIFDIYGGMMNHDIVIDQFLFTFVNTSRCYNDKQL